MLKLQTQEICSGLTQQVLELKNALRDMKKENSLLSKELYELRQEMRGQSTVDMLCESSDELLYRTMSQGARNILQQQHLGVDGGDKPKIGRAHV